MHIYILGVGHRVSRPRGTGSVGDNVGEGGALYAGTSDRSCMGEMRGSSSSRSWRMMNGANAPSPLLAGCSQAL